VDKRRAYIVGVSEESDTSNNTSADMVPSERGLVDLSEGESPSLVGIGNVCEVIVEVVESGIASGGLVGNSRSSHYIGVSIDRSRGWHKRSCWRSVVDECVTGARRVTRRWRGRFI
jgi:hypothetical protein